MVSACVLIRTAHGKFEEAVKIIRQIKGVERVFTVLGRYDAVADIANMNQKNLGTTVLRLGRMSGVVFTETLLEIEH